MTALDVFNFFHYFAWGLFIIGLIAITLIAMFVVFKGRD
jgi:tetrahydromethanopterin S-methyltransferase subunit B